MTGISREHLQTRLNLAFAHHLDEAERRRHLGVILATVEASPRSGEPTRGLRRSLRRWMAVTAAVLAGLFPVSVAVAAQGSVPGEQLYQVKLATESVRAFIDPLVSVRHRVEELEALVARSADPEAIEAARAAAWAGAESLNAGHLLLARLEAIEQILANHQPKGDVPTGEGPPPAVDPGPVFAGDPGEDDEDVDIEELRSDRDRGDSEGDDDLDRGDERRDRDDDEDDDRDGDDRDDDDRNDDDGDDNDGDDNDGDDDDRDDEDDEVDEDDDQNHG